MRPRFIFPLALSLLLAGCGYDIKETGISRSTAIGIAERHCAEYPDRFSYVDTARWDFEGKYWLVSLMDRDDDAGRDFKISRTGGIISSHLTGANGTEIGYDQDETAPRHHAAAHHAAPRESQPQSQQQNIMGSPGQ
jgi:hypothetical protein